MSFGGPQRSDTSTSNTTVDTTTSTVDNRAAGSGATFGGNVTTGPGDITGTLAVSTTDFGAILAGKDLALESIRALTKSAESTKSIASDTIQQAYGLANSARQSETSGAINNVVKYGAIVAIAGISLFIIIKYAK